jgi:hypothetical protein
MMRVLGLVKAVVALLFVTAGVLWFTASRGEAAVFKAVQSGSASFASATAQTINLRTGTDITKAFVTCSSSTSSNNDLATYTCVLQDSGNDPELVITPGGSNTGTVQWYVAEFESGVRVQRGTLTVDGTSGAGLSVTQSLTTGGYSAVDATKSFILQSHRINLNSNNATEQTTIRSILASDGLSLTVSRNEGTTTDLFLHWQVVEMQGASVQRGTVCIGNTTNCPGTTNGSGSTDQLNTATLTTAVDPCKTILLHTRRGGTAVAGVDSEITNSIDFSSAVTCGVTQTGLTFRRNIRSTTATHDLQISYEAVTLSDGTAVRRGTIGQLSAFGANTTSLASAAFTAVDLALSVPFISVVGGSTGTQQSGIVAWRAAWTDSNATGLTFTRQVSSTVASQIAFQAVQFFRCTNNPICSVSAGQDSSGSVNVSWAPIFRTACTGASSTIPALCDALVLRRLTAVNADAPTDGVGYSVGNTIGSSTVVKVGAGTTATDTLSVDTDTYCYKVFAKVPGANTYQNLTTSADCTSTSETKIIMKGGDQAWSYATTGGSSLRAPVSSGDTSRVFLGTNGNKLVGINGTTGAEIGTPVPTMGAVQGYVSWFPQSDGTTGEFGTDQSATVTDQAGYVTSIDGSTGATRWAVVPPNVTALSAPVTVQVRARQFGASANFIANAGDDLIYVASANAVSGTQRVSALRATDGSVKWTFNPQLTAPMDRTVVQPWVDYARDRLYIASRSTAAQASLWILNTLDGSLVTRFSGLGDIQTAPTVAYDNTILYVGNQAGKLIAVDLVNLVTKYPAGLSTLTLDSAVKSYVFEDFNTPGRIYFTTNSGVWCVNAGGSDVDTSDKCGDWTTNPQAQSGVTFTAVVLGDGALFMGGSDGKLYQVDSTTGARVKRFTVEDGVSLGAPSAQVDGFGNVVALYVGSNSGKVYKITLSGSNLPGTEPWN